MASRRKSGKLGKSGAKVPKKGLPENKHADSGDISPLFISDPADPYHFDDTQSFQPDTQPTKKLHNSDSVIPKEGSEKNHPATPVQENCRTPARLKTAKRSPRFFSEAERLQQEEDELLQRALEASLQEKERQDRKRRREEKRERDEQSAIIQSLSKKTHLNRVTDSVGKAKDLTEQDSEKSYSQELHEVDGETTITAEDIDATPPLTIASGITPFSIKDSQTKRIRVSVEKLSVSSLAKRLSSTQALNEADSAILDPSSEKCGDVTVSTPPLSRRGTSMDLSERESNSEKDENQPQHDLTTVSTPPLSREAAVGMLDCGKTGEVASSPKSDSVEGGSLAGTEESLGNMEGPSEQTEGHLDLALIDVLTTSSNLATNTPASDTHSLPFKPVNSSQHSRTDSFIAVLNDNACQSKSINQSTSEPPSDTTRCVAEPVKSRNRGGGGLSLKRKRTSSDAVIIEENAMSMSRSIAEIPPAKRTKTTPVTHKKTANDQDTIITAEVTEIKEDNVAHDVSVGQGGSSKRLSLRTKHSKAAVIVEAVPKISNFEDVSPNQSKTPSRTNGPKLCITPPQAVIKTDLCTLNPSLPPMYCPPDSTPSEHTPLIIQRLNSYFCQLREAQSKVLTRLKWGKPVKMGSSCQLNLDFGRKTRRSRNAEKVTNCTFLALPKRKLSNTQDKCAEGVDEAPESKVFSLLSDGSEDVEADGVLQSLCGQRATESGNVLSQEDEKLRENADSAPDMEEMVVDEAEHLDTLTDEPGGDPPSTIETEGYDDLIVLDTQLEDHPQLNVFPPGSPNHLTISSPSPLASSTLTRSPITSAPNQSPITPQRIPPLQKSPVLSHRSTGVQKSPAMSETSNTDTRSPITNQLSISPLRQHSESPAGSTESRSPLRSKVGSDKDTSPTWLNSRLSSQAAKPHKKGTQKSKPTKKDTRSKKLKSRQPKSAAARMMLEFAHDSGSEMDDDRSRNSSLSPQNWKKSSSPFTKNTPKPSTSANIRKSKTAASTIDDSNSEPEITTNRSTSKQKTSLSPPTDRERPRPAKKDARKRKSPLSTSLKTRGSRKPKSAAASILLEFVHNTCPEVGKSKASPSKSPLSDDDDDRAFSTPRRTSLKGRRRNISTSSESEREPEPKGKAGGSPGVIDLTEDTQAHSTSPQPPSLTSSTRHTSTSPAPTRLTRRKSTSLKHNKEQSTCPMCSKYFPSSVIEVHAAQCNGEDDPPSQSYNTRRTASRASRSSGRMYQPNLREIQSREREKAKRAGYTIESSDSELSQRRSDPNSIEAENPLLEELSTRLDADPYQYDDNDFGCVSSPPQAVAPRVIPSEDGGFIVDESTISNSPIRTFTKLSDLQDKDREQFQNQFNKRQTRNRGGSRSSTGPGRTSNGGRAGGGAWSNDFGELAQSSSSSGGRGKRQSKGTGRSWRGGKSGYYKGKPNRSVRRKKN